MTIARKILVELAKWQNWPPMHALSCWPHSKLDWLTPDQFYFNSLPSKEAA
jgi:hypothetical protein